MKLKAVYVGQYGYFYKFTPLEWLIFCIDAIQEDGYDLPDSHLLKIRPKTIRFDPLEEAHIPHSSNTFANPGYRLVWPLDWYDQDLWLDEIKEVSMILGGK